jgi:beta-barrel assembly-enhancing protease
MNTQRSTRSSLPFLSLPLTLLSLLVVAVGVVSLPGCQTAPAQAAQRFAADTLLPVSEENKLGQQMAAEVEKQVKLHPDRGVQEYVQRIGQRVAAKAVDKPKGIQFTFKVVDDDKTVNAFALPGGHIYVYSGLMKLAADEAELASVIGHEIAHVTERHIAERLVTQLGLQTVAALALGQNPSLLAQVAAQVVGTGAFLSFSRQQEAEADARGLPYMAAAGYDPLGFVRLFTKLRRGEGPAFARFLSAHPLPSERIEAANERIARMKNPPTERNRREYMDLQREL